MGGPGIWHLARTRHGSVAARNGMGGERFVQEAPKCADLQSEGIAPSTRTRHRLLSLTQERMAHTAQLHSRGIGNVVPGVSNVWHCQPSSPRKRQSNSSRDATQATNSRPHARRDWRVCAPIPAGMRPGDKSQMSFGLLGWDDREAHEQCSARVGSQRMGDMFNGNGPGRNPGQKGLTVRSR